MKRLSIVKNSGWFVVTEVSLPWEYLTTLFGIGVDNNGVHVISGV